LVGGVVLLALGAGALAEPVGDAVLLGKPVALGAALGLPALLAMTLVLPIGGVWVRSSSPVPHAKVPAAASVPSAARVATVVYKTRAGERTNQEDFSIRATLAIRRHEPTKRKPCTPHDALAGTHTAIFPVATTSRAAV
jgi:hypothetical protein